MTSRHRDPGGRSFYRRALERADRQLAEEARELTGLDDEIALLRVSIFRLLEAGDTDPRHLHAAMRVLIQALTARHRLSGEQSERLGETTARLLEEFVALFAAAGEEAAP